MDRGSVLGREVSLGTGVGPFFLSTSFLFKLVNTKIVDIHYTNLLLPAIFCTDNMEKKIK